MSTICHRNEDERQSKEASRWRRHFRMCMLGRSTEVFLTTKPLGGRGLYRTRDDADVRHDEEADDHVHQLDRCTAGQDRGRASKLIDIAVL